VLIILILMLPVSFSFNFDVFYLFIVFLLIILTTSYTLKNTRVNILYDIVVTNYMIFMAENADI